MPKLFASRSAQYVKYSEFTFLISDTMVMTDGVEKAFSVLAPVADVINLPDGAVIVSGALVVETVSNVSGANTATLAVGDSASPSRYLAATTLKTAGRTVLGLTGYRGLGENIRITIANSAADATAGRFTLRVGFVMPSQANETYPS